MEDGRVVVTSEIFNSYLNIDGFCDNNHHELLNQYPKHIQSLNNTNFLDLIDYTSNHTSAKEFQWHQNWTFAGKLYTWLGYQTNIHEKIVSPLVKGISSYNGIAEYCKGKEFENFN